jgi:MFS family permease
MSTNTGKIDTIIHASLGFAAGLSAAFFAVLATRLGASPWLLALISSAPYLSNLLAPLWVSLARRTGVRFLMVLSLAAASFILLALGTIHSSVVFAILVLVYYFLYGVGDPLYVALAEIIYPERTGTILGRVQGVFNAVRAAANAVAGWLMDSIGVFATFVLSAVATGTAAASYLKIVDLKYQNTSPYTVSPLQILQNSPVIRRIVIALMVGGTGMVMTLPAFPSVEVHRLGLSNGQIGMLLAVNSTSLVLMGLVWGRRLSDTPKHILKAFQLGMAAIIGMAILYALAKSFLVLLIANILCGIGGSALSIGWKLFAINLANFNTDDLSGLHLLTCGIRGIYAPVLGALLIALWNPAADFWVAAILVFIGILLFPSVKSIEEIMRHE